MLIIGLLHAACEFGPFVMHVTSSCPLRCKLDAGHQSRADCDWTAPEMPGQSPILFHAHVAREKQCQYGFDYADQHHLLTETPVYVQVGI